MVRQRITSDRSTFEVVKPLPVPPLAAGASDVDSALDEAIAGAAGDGERDKNTRIGRNERITFGVIEPGRSVRDLADRSMLGEFETSKALYNLVEQGYLKPVAPPRVSLVAKAGPSIAGVAAAWAVRFALYGAIGAGAYFAAVKLLPHPVHASEPRPLVHAESRRLLARAQAARLSQALETFRVEKGAYPESLKELVEAKLVAENDLSFPWREPYFYRKTERGFVLLPPLD
jgi:hypothetical protein